MRFLGWQYYVLIVRYQCKEGNISREQKRLPIWILPRLCLMGLHPWLDPLALISHNCDYNNFQWVLWNFQVNCQNWGCLRNLFKFAVGLRYKSSIQFSSVAQSCLTLCDPMNLSMPGLPIHHQLPEFTQTHVHWVGDAIQPSHPLSSP